MKKFFLMLAVASCAVFTSCNSDAEKPVEKTDAEKAAELAIDAEKAVAEGDMTKASELGAELVKILEANKDNADFEKQAEEAYNKLKEAEKK